MAQTPVLIGIDIGTSSVKAVMLDMTGTSLAAYAQAYGMARPEPGAAVQDPADWMHHVEAALAGFARHPRAQEVAAIGVTSQVNTHVFCDAGCAPLAPALTWQDTRPGAQGARLDGRITPEAKVAALGAPIPIDASHALARMAWMAEEHPEVWTRTASVLSPKDYAIARLSGQVVADPIASIGLVGTDLAYAAPVLDLVPGAATRLPELRDPLAVAGHVGAGRPFAGRPVATGTMDAWASMFGLGVADDGQAMYLSGSSEVLGLISRTVTGSAGAVTFPPWRGITLHAGPTQAGGAALAWLAQLLGEDLCTIDRLASGARLDLRSPLFLPHLEGERAPLWDPISRGAFIGLDSASGPAELVLAVMEGVAYSARAALEAVEASGGRAAQTLGFGGGGARSDAWAQIRANALGRRLSRVAVPEAGAVGAAAMAAVAAGITRTVPEATQAVVAMDRDFEPDKAASALAEDRYELFRELYPAVSPLHRRMARTGARTP